MKSMNDRKNCCLGIDIGKSHIKAGIVSAEGKVLAQKHQDVECRGLESLLGQIVSIAQQLRQADADFSLQSAGIGLPAMLRKSSQEVSLSLAMPFLNGVNFRERAQEALGIPVAVDNDANVAALGEMHLGAAQGVDSFIYINIGSRVGASIVIDRKIYRGSSGYAGELGHIAIDPDGKKCLCGNMGCLERYVSASAIAQRVQERLNLNPSSALQIITDRPVSVQDVSAAALLGDKMASVIVSDVGRYLGIAISNLIDLLNVEMIVLGGGITENGEILLVPALEEIKRRTLAPPYDDCKVVLSALGSAAGVIGAALLAYAEIQSQAAG
jgi:glucokinase-like ROK family protein